MPKFFEKVGGVGVALATAALLSGCAAQVVSSSQRTVVVRAGDYFVADAQKLADTECARHGRFARLIARPNASSSEFVFDCVT